MRTREVAHGRSSSEEACLERPSRHCPADASIRTPPEQMEAVQRPLACQQSHVQLAAPGLPPPNEGTDLRFDNGSASPMPSAHSVFKLGLGAWNGNLALKVFNLQPKVVVSIWSWLN